MALTVFSSLATGWLLEIMGTPSDISDFAYDYIHVIFTYGIISSMFYNVLANVLRALGDSKTPLYFLIIASVCNVVLDLFFILVCGMGVEGAAVATVLSQFISGGLCIVYMIKKFPILRLTREDMPFSGSMSVRLVGQGLPMALQFSITAVGSVILQSAVNSLGSDAVAAVTAANKVQLFVSQPMESIGITMATYCGQNLGAGRAERIRRGVLSGCVIELCYVVMAFFLIYFGSGAAVLLFLKSDETAVIADAVRFLRTCAFFYPVLGLIFVLRNSVQGLGYGVPAMAAGLFELAARACVALVFVGKFGYAAICYSGPAAWVAADVLLIPMLFVTLRLVRKHLDKDRSQQSPAAYGQTGAGGGDICSAGGDACEGIS